MRLALGTANLGQHYGITNKVHVNRSEAIEIIRFAHSRGIRDFDTAPDYGSAEALIKDSLIGDESRIQIKIPAKVGSNLSEITSAVEGSLRNLNINKADTILFHDPKIYNSDKFPYIVESLSQNAYSKNIGLSCYSAEDVVQSYQRCKLLNFFQVPENILDRRILRNPDVLRLAGDGCKFQVRSVFLQGLLLINPDEYPENLASCREPVKSLHNFTLSHNFSLIQLLLSYVMQIEWADSIVIGANSVNQVDELIKAATNLLVVDWEQFDSISEPLIDPRNWNQSG